MQLSSKNIASRVGRGEVKKCLQNRKEAPNKGFWQMRIA